MDVKDYLWYPYLAYQKQCKEERREDTINEWLILTGKIPAPPKSVVVESVTPVKSPPVIATTKIKKTRKNILGRKKKDG